MGTVAISAALAADSACAAVPIVRVHSVVNSHCCWALASFGPKSYEQGSAIRLLFACHRAFISGSQAVQVVSCPICPILRATKLRAVARNNAKCGCLTIGT